MDVVYALADTGIVTPNGAYIRVVPGEHWPANDPVVVDNPSLFTSDPTAIGLRVSAPLVTEAADEPAPVEQATRAPGEKRQTRRPQQ